MADETKVTAATCGAALYPNGLRCARTPGHDGKHNNVGEFIEWAEALCWESLIVDGQPHACIKPFGHEGGHGDDA